MTDQEGTRGPEVRGTPIDEPPPFEALVPDPLVEVLVPDPSQPPTPTVSLLGLLGRSTKEGYWRLYFSSTLKHYVEFKEEDVLHSVKIPRDQPPFAGIDATRVWIKGDAEVEYTRTESRRVQANSLAARWPPQGAEGKEGFEERAVYTRPHVTTTEVAGVIEEMAIYIKPQGTPEVAGVIEDGRIPPF